MASSAGGCFPSAGDLSNAGLSLSSMSELLRASEGRCGRQGLYFTREARADACVERVSWVIVCTGS